MISRASVLFVCLGNICRSPMAEGAMRVAAREAGLDLLVDSAGTGGWHIGSPPDSRAIAIARAMGVDISDLRARQVERSDFHRFAHIFALDGRNLADLRRLQPGDAAAELSLLLDMVPGREGQAVADPYYGEDDGFAVAWRDVSNAAEMLAQRLGV